LPSISDTIDQLDNITITNTGSDKELATPLYSDQILPFDITLTGDARSEAVDRLYEQLDRPRIPTTRAAGG